MANWEKLVLATGSSAQYIKGDGTLGTYSTTDSTKFPLTGGTLTGSMNIFTSSGDANLRLRSGSTRSGVFIDKPNTTSIMGSMLVLASDSSFRLGTASYYHMEMTQSGNTILKGGGSTALTINTSQQATFSNKVTITKNESDEYDTVSYTNSLLKLTNTNTSATQPHSLITFRLEKMVVMVI